MTTIAWRPGEIAADTLITAGFRRSEATKIAERNGVLAGACGALEYLRVFLDWFRAGMHGDIFTKIGPVDETSQHENAFGWVFYMDVVLEFTPSGCCEVRAPYFAGGSGAPFATTALLLGASPREAVVAAMRLDLHSGGHVQVLKGRP